MAQREKSNCRIAVVGAGLIGQKHLDVVAEFAQLDGIVEPNVAADGIAAQHGVTRFADVASYLAQNKPDGVIVATPNQLHLEHGAAFLREGVPVLMEKPLAENSQAAAALVACSQETSAPILVGHHRRHSALAKAAKAVIERGDLGRIVAVNAQFWLKKPDDYFDVAWRRQKGAGPTFINLIHDIDLLRHFCGDIVAVQAVESNRERGLEVEDTSAVILEFDTGALGTVSISDTVVAPWSWELTAGENPAYPKTEMSCYTLGGTKGSLSIPDLRMWHHPGAQSWWAPIEDRDISVGANDPVAAQFRHFLDVIERGQAPLVSGEEGLKNLRVLDAIKRAAITGTREQVLI